ncbi:MAG: hypothetical protein KKB50_10835 [Planctomycetes bacterium]|nr:hypothetical protein [Planctomycetota bacterium]
MRQRASVALGVVLAVVLATEARADDDDKKAARRELRQAQENLEEYLAVCKACKGEGERNGRKCPRCNGKGAWLKVDKRLHEKWVKAEAKGYYGIDGYRYKTPEFSRIDQEYQQHYRARRAGLLREYVSYVEVQARWRAMIDNDMFLSRQTQQSTAAAIRAIHGLSYAYSQDCLSILLNKGDPIGTVVCVGGTIQGFTSDDEKKYAQILVEQTRPIDGRADYWVPKRKVVWVRPPAGLHWGTDAHVHVIGIITEIRRERSIDQIHRDFAIIEALHGTE